jgi:hypothetical protein
VFARLERIAQPIARSDAALPAGALEIEEVIDENRLASSRNRP